jgi:hypothetical protein
MAKPISYADAVRMLGEEPVVTALGKIFGSALLSAATLGVSEALSWFDPKPDAVRLGHELVGGVRDRITGLGRYDRTQRLQAAHAIIVITAFFEALDEIGLPFTAEEIELSREELLAVGSVERVPGLLIKTIFHTGIAVPEVHLPYEQVLLSLHGYYTEIGEHLAAHLAGLEVWSRLDATRRDRARRSLDGLADAARARYEVLYRRLAEDFPEFAFWAGLGQHQATRDTLRTGTAAVRDDLRTGLAGLHRLLAALTPGRVPAHQLAAISRINEAALGHAVADTEERLDGLIFPTLAEAYVDPAFRVVSAAAEVDFSSEEWWDGVEVDDDLPGFLAGYLTSPRAVEAPLVVLGHPGAGKSVFTKMMAARLDSQGFLPVRVPLRRVPADAQIQEQIEQAVYGCTGERSAWSDLSRSGGGALPLVLLDGLDELLQATGVQRADYLVQVAQFQWREAELGRPVAVIVTARTAVADRCRFPVRTLVVRLEPFDNRRVERWLDVWNSANAGYFTSRGIRPLSTRTALSHGELARQPLLLLMLALYDADANALLDNKGLSTAELYERLLVRFAEREVDKRREGLPPRERREAVERQLLRLSITAFAMFNRGRQWVTAGDLDDDLAVLLPAPPAPSSGFRSPLGPADLAIGGFFFVHRARASRDREELRTYEFLHATFGEYLIARLIHQVLTEMADRDERPSALLGGSRAEDGLFHALTSFAALSSRLPVLDFLLEKSRGDARLPALLIQLFRTREERTDRSYDRYSPVELPVVSRHAYYSTNLVLITTFLSGPWRVSELCRPGGDPLRLWQSVAMLWRSVLTPQEWNGLIACLGVEPVHADGDRDIRLTVLDGYGYHKPDLTWTFAPVPSSGPPKNDFHSAFALLTGADFLRLPELDLLIHVANAFDTGFLPMESMIGTIVRIGEAEAVSAASTLIEIWTALYDLGVPTRSYHNALTVAGAIDSRLRPDFVAAVLSRLEHDLPRLPPRDAESLLNGLMPYSPEPPALAPFVRCVLALYARRGRADGRFNSWFAHIGSDHPLLALRIVVALIELGEDHRWIPEPFEVVRRFDASDLLSAHAGDPQLYHRAKKIIKAYGEPYGLTGLDWPDVLNPHM